MFIVYSKDNCPACENAKKMLHESKKEYTIMKIVQDDAVDGEINRVDFIEKFPGVRVVPYIQTPTNTYVKNITELQSYINSM